MPRHMSAGIPWWRVALLLTLCNWPVLGKTRTAAVLGGSADLVGVGAGDADWGDLGGAACSVGQPGPLFSPQVWREMAGVGVWFQLSVSVACGRAVMVDWFAGFSGGALVDGCGEEVGLPAGQGRPAAGG
jgi:hypothetical protein